MISSAGRVLKQVWPAALAVSTSAQALHPTARRTMTTFSPRGPHWRSSDGPNSATVRTPHAAAKWDMPLSLPRYTALRLSNAATRDKGRSLATTPWPQSGSSPPLSFSTGPRSKITSPPRVSRHHRVTARKFSAGQFFSRAPLPGAMANTARRGSDCSAQYSSDQVRAW